VWEEDVERAIARSQPQVGCRWKDAVFDLGKRLKLVPRLADKEIGELRPIVEEWYRRARHVARTPLNEVWEEVVNGWPKIRDEIGEFDLAFERAKTRKPPIAMNLYEGDAGRVLLASLCRELQRDKQPGENIFIATRRAAEKLGIDPSTVSRRLKVLCADRILRAGPKGSLEDHRASEYEYVASDLYAAD
jgi:hypothetical protein